jgi:hypothetical protein
MKSHQIISKPHFLKFWTFSIEIFRNNLQAHPKNNRSQAFGLALISIHGSMDCNFSFGIA